LFQQVGSFEGICPLQNGTWPKQTASLGLNCERQITWRLHDLFKAQRDEMEKEGGGVGKRRIPWGISQPEILRKWIWQVASKSYISQASNVQVPGVS
jgi:hypothetical protein